LPVVLRKKGAPDAPMPVEHRSPFRQVMAKAKGIFPNANESFKIAIESTEILSWPRLYKGE